MRIKQGISPITLANYLLEKNKKSKCVGMDQMKLIYLVYYCHGLHLAEYGSPLVNELAEAYAHGPIFPSIFQETKDTGLQPLTKLLDDRSGDQLTASQKQLVDAVYADHCKFTGFELMMREIKGNTPWAEVFVEQRKSHFPISNKLIKEYYAEMLDAQYA